MTDCFEMRADEITPVFYLPGRVYNHESLCSKFASLILAVRFGDLNRKAQLGCALP